MLGFLWAIIVTLLALWVLGLVFKIAGAFIHILLTIAVALVIINVVSGAFRRGG